MTSPDSGTRAEPQPHTARVGDWIEAAGAGESPPRRGLIREVLGEGHHTHFRVKWDEQHESIFYPGEQHFVIHPARSRIADQAEPDPPGS